MAWDNTDYFFSGQGVVLIGDRDSSGNPAGLIPIGNVSELKLSISTSVLEHKESKTGQRATDFRLTTETKGALSMTVENFNSVNLAAALRGTATPKASATVSNEAVKGYFGKVLPLNHMLISAVTVTNGATPLVAYTNTSTPWDYKINAEGGSIMLNDGSAQALASLTADGAAVSGVTVGTTTTITMTHAAKVGDWVAFDGFTGADAALLNDKAHRIVEVTGTSSFKVATDTAGKTITVGTAEATFDGVALEVDYTYQSQYLVDPMVLGSPEKWLRFEGLNTADNNASVVVDIFRFLADPLKELSFISDGLNNFVLEGNMLADSGRTSGSKFFRQMMIR